MPAQAARKRNTYTHNGAYPFVMKGVQNLHTGVHRYVRTDLQPLRCIIYDTATDPAMGSAGFLLGSAKYLQENYKKELMNKEINKHYNTKMFSGFDIDPSMLRINVFGKILLSPLLLQNV